MAKKKAKKKSNKAKSQMSPSKKKISNGVAILLLILNVIILPGLGTIIGGKNKEGIWQLILAIIGWITLIFWIGIPILLVAWIWGIFSGVKLIQESA